MRIVCVGDCGVDHYLPENRLLPGGITANFARHARRVFPARDSVAIVSAVGDDDGAALVLSALEDTGIECHIKALPGITPIQYIEVQPDGERQFVAYEAGVLRDLRFGDAERRIIAACDLLVAPVYLQISGLFGELMSLDTGGRVAIDFADFLQHPDFALLEKYLAKIDIGFFGLDAGDRQTIAALEALARRTGRLFVVTLGAAGSMAFAGGEAWRCPAMPVERVVDTTGAGDAFAAAFLAAYCADEQVPAALRHAASLAAEVVQRQGAFW